MRHEVTITLRCTIPEEHKFKNVKAITDEVAGAAFAQLEAFTDDHGVAYEKATVDTQVVTVDPAMPSSPLDWPHFSIPEWLWEENGDENDPTNRLLCAVYIDNIPYHAEARAVMPDDHPDRNPDYLQELMDEYADDYEHLIALAGESGEPFHTTTIRGRKYLCFLTPFYD